MNTNGQEEAEAKVAAAKEDVAAAELKVAAAKEHVAAAVEKHSLEKNEDAKSFLLDVCKSAQKEVESAQKELESAQTVFSAVRNLLAVLLNPKQHQQHEQGQLSQELISKVENSVCVLIENNKHFGCGFAVSNSHVYTAAHHWEKNDDEGAIYFAVKVGDTVECIQGKPSANKRFTLQVLKIDKHLDYCILERTGVAVFAEWLETDVSPELKMTTPVFLAAYQIGIQDQLNHDYDFNVSLGIASGAVVRRTSRHMAHSCLSFKGDSGGAIVLGNGKVIALHIAAVNEAEELADLEEVDLGSVAESFNQLCSGQYSGSVALLLSAIKQ